MEILTNKKTLGLLYTALSEWYTIVRIYFIKGKRKLD